MNKLRCILCVLVGVAFVLLTSCYTPKKYEPTKFKIGECFSVGVVEKWTDTEDPNSGLVYLVVDKGIEHYLVAKAVEHNGVIRFYKEEHSAVWEDDMYEVKCPKYFKKAE